jgi:hypothetical protein
MAASNIEVHTILTPVVPVLHEFKLLLEQRVIGMGYRKTLRRIVRCRCS